jgi:hypothetical protein
MVQWLVSQGAAIDARNNGGSQPLHVASSSGHLEVAAFLEREMLKLQRRPRCRNNKQLDVKPALSQEEAQQAEKARQQAELELLAMCEGEGQSKKKSKKKSKVSNSNSEALDVSGAGAEAVANSGAGPEGELFVPGSEVVRAGAAPHLAVEDGGAPDRSRDVANALLAKAIQEASSQQPGEHVMSRLEAALTQATSANEELIAQATQQRKAIKGKLKRLRNKETKVARAIGALEAAMASRTAVGQLTDAISRAETLVSDTSSDALSGALALAKARLEDALTEQRAAQKEAALDTAGEEFVALALSQAEIRNHTAELPIGQQPDQNDSTLCVVCINNPKTVVLLPCRHMCVCPECCRSMLQVEPLCPLCRAHKESHIEAYM